MEGRYLPGPLHSATKLEMGDADHRPVNHQGRHHQRHQQAKRFTRHHIVNHHAKRRGDGRYRQRGQRDPPAVNPQQRLLSQAEQHPAVAVHTAVVDRQRGGEHHQIESVGHNIAVNGMKDQHKGATPLHDVTPGIE